MSIRKTLARLLVLAVLEVGALGGVPINPEQIRKLMQVMHETRAEYVVKNESDEPEEPTEDDRDRRRSR